MEWGLVLAAVLATFLVNVVFSKGHIGMFISIPLILTAIITGGYAFMSKEGFFIKQKDVVANTNTGAKVSNVPITGVNLPPIRVEQEGINANTNTGLDFLFDPNSGPVKLNHTVVENENMRVVINPDAGTVIINPSVGNVKFVHERKNR